MKRMARRKKPQVAPSDGTDHFTALPLELRARIASLLPFREVVQLSSLSWPWRDIHIHHHTPVVELNLDEFLVLQQYNFDPEHSLPGIIDDDAILGLRVALFRRARDPAASKVDTLILHYDVGDPRMARHADRIVSLADARKVRITISYDLSSQNPSRPRQVTWTLDLPPAARRLDITGKHHIFNLAPAIAGPGVAALQKLCLHRMAIRGWPPCLPSLRSLTLKYVAIEAPFKPGEWCPLLEDLCISSSGIEHTCVDISLPLLKSLDMDDVDVSERSEFFESYGDITIDAPNMETMAVDCTVGGTTDYLSFTLLAPRLRYLYWRNQYVLQRVRIKVGSPSNVIAGTIVFEANAEIAYPEIKYYKVLMMRMLEELLPELSPESVAIAARPYMTLEKYTVEGCGSGEMIPDERLTCNLEALMSSLKI
ncbi:hypothetical protein EJB05_13369, partial [Eragrostis curvula]